MDAPDNKITEDLLLKQVTNGSEPAFQELMDKYMPILYNFLLKLTFDKSLSEELLQDTFLKIWMTRENLDRVQNFKAYLFTISRNQAINAVKKVIREKEKFQDWKQYAAQTQDAGQDEEWKYLLIDEAIAALPLQQRTVLIMSRKQGIKLDEIAARMNLSKTTVKKYLQLALTSINKYVEARLTIAFLLATATIV